jgi:hypothetical protein
VGRPSPCPSATWSPAPRRKGWSNTAAGGGPKPRHPVPVRPTTVGPSIPFAFLASPAFLSRETVTPVRLALSGVFLCPDGGGQGGTEGSGENENPTGDIANGVGTYLVARATGLGPVPPPNRHGLKRTTIALNGAFSDHDSAKIADLARTLSRLASEDKALLAAILLSGKQGGQE